MSDSRNNKKDKNQHIQVFVRVRPTNNNEKIGKSVTVVDVPSSKELVVRERPQDKLTKKFTFDKVFGPNSKQIDVYNAVVSPLVDEVLAGYNCTVFAYGQTGTGKTFTMEGVSHDPAMHWQSDTSAGIIPRTLSHLFDELRLLDAQEYTVRVSFLELYNEELFDLLSPSDDASKIRLYEDGTKKGAVIIHGLEEVTVHNKSEVYKILEKGSEKRQTAATLMNAHSSRSHTVFSITVHIKENTVDGEELLKTGKMNLVDLAGSENVGRSGAVDRRAREAGNINQSLLTLGRVITALVERAPHVPYRESKLTRLLQESLGGRTKTSIIATISPASINLEETLSTLDYAYRAKNITNRPEINQKLSKKALLKEYTEEIERLRRDLAATRERNGVYLAQDNYNEMQVQIECQGKDIEEKINHIKALEDAMLVKEKLFNDLQSAYETQTQILQMTKQTLEKKKRDLKNTKNMLEDTKFDRDLQKHLVEKHVSTEKCLFSQAETLLDVAETATTDTSKLHDKISRKKHVEEQNEKIEQQFKEEISQQLTNIEEEMSTYIKNCVQFYVSRNNQIDSQTTILNEGIDETIKHISKDIPNKHLSISEEFSKSVNKSYNEYNEWLIREMQKTDDFSQHEKKVFTSFFSNLSSKYRELWNNKLAENLRLLSNDFSDKIEKVLETAKQSINVICDNYKVDRDRIANELTQLEKTVQTNLEIENKKIQERQNVYQDLERAYTAMKNNFEEVLRKAKACQEKDTNEPVTNHLCEVYKICSTVNEQSLVGLQESSGVAKHEEDKIERDIKKLKSDVISTLEQNYTLADAITVQGNNLVTEMETEVSCRMNALTSYQDAVKTNGIEFKIKLEENKITALSSIQELDKTVHEMSVDHEKLMEGQRNKLFNVRNENKRKLESQSEDMNMWRAKISTQLHTTKHQVDKFLLEDLRHDQPTGTTPVRKDFQFPRELTVTSPHERIIQRFRESRLNLKKESSSEDEVDETMKMNDNEIFKTPLSQINFTDTLLLNSDNEITASTPNKILDPNRFIVRSVSSSELYSNTKISYDTKANSEITIPQNENKENGEDGITNGKKAKLLKRSNSRISQPSRKVLGSSNSSNC